MKRTAILGLIATLTLAALFTTELTADDKKASVLLQAAQAKETIQGDLKGAIELYKNAVKEAGASRALAATALIRMAECYQKLGDTESHKIYEQVVRDYGDQKDAVTTARARLSGTQADTGIVAQQVGPRLGDKRYVDAISSDGRYVGIEEHGRIFVHDLRTLEEHIVIGVFNSSKEKFESPFISPDGKQLACLRVLPEGLKDLYILGADGSNPRVVAKGVTGLWGWSPDGKRLGVTVSGDNGNQGILLSVADGSRQPIAGLGLSAESLARISRDGRYIAFVRDGAPGLPQGIYTLPIEGGRPVLLAENSCPDTRPVWTPDGKQLLFNRERSGIDDLWSIPVVNGAPAGPARVVHRNIDTLLDVTAAGDIYYQVGIDTRELYVAGVDAQATRLTSQPKQLTNGEMPPLVGAAWSPDGQYLAYYTGEETQTVVIRSARTWEVRNVIPKYPLNERWGEPLTLQPVWSADSRSLFLHSTEGRVGWLDIQTGEVKPVWDDNSLLPVYRDGAAVPSYRPTVALSSDGRTIYHLERDAAAHQTMVMRVDLQTRAKTEIYRMDADTVRGFELSRDGSRLLITKLRAVPGMPPPGGVISIVILPAAGGGATELAMPPEAREGPSWSSDGRRLFFTTKNPAEIYSMPVEGGPPQPLSRGVDLREVFFLRASPDGTQIVFTDEQWDSRLWVLKNALNRTTTAR
jgi:Tol biopolymer transport system component